MSLDKIREHYEIEKQLAVKLRNSTREDRRNLYGLLYKELFRLVPHHPQLTSISSLENASNKVAFQMRNIRAYLMTDAVFMEVGAGDCALAAEVAKSVAKVYAIDVTRANVLESRIPKNVEFILSDGCSIPIQARTVNIAYSYQLMEHLHPDDAADQLQSIYNVMRPGGIYICDTPNRLCGPHDVSRYFDPIATGFHLKEYSIKELYNLFKIVGFSKIRIHMRIRQVHANLPPIFGTLVESLLDSLPYVLRKKVSNTWPISLLLGIRMIGTK